MILNIKRRLEQQPNSELTPFLKSCRCGNFMITILQTKQKNNSICILILCSLSPINVSSCSTDPLLLQARLSFSALLSPILTTLFDLSYCCMSFASAIWSSPKAYILFKRSSISLHLSASLFPLSDCFPHNITPLHQWSRDRCRTSSAWFSQQRNALASASSLSVIK